VGVTRRPSPLRERDPFNPPMNRQPGGVHAPYLPTVTPGPPVRSPGVPAVSGRSVATQTFTPAKGVKAQAYDEIVADFWKEIARQKRITNIFLLAFGISIVGILVATALRVG